MEFGVFIRSISERTEKLCIEACKQSMDFSRIHLIRNCYPAYKAYGKMFRMADKLGYDWYLGLDADVVLKKDWCKIAMDKIEEIKDRDYFNFSFAIQDKFLGIIDRGNHFYNGEYAKKALWILENKTKHTLKSESYISRYVSKNMPEKKTVHFQNIVIGYHGYEQYYKDIFYRFWLRRKRGDNVSKYKNLFKDNSKIKNDKDFLVAKLGYEHEPESIFKWLLRRFQFNKSVHYQFMIGKINTALEENYIAEKPELLKMKLDDFYKLYGTA